MPAEHAPRVAVVGGGIAGLVTAWQLAGWGVHVDLYELTDHVGGRVCGRDLHGFPLDLGAESFSLRNGEVEHFLRDLGVVNRVQHPRAHPSWVYHLGHCSPLPALGSIGIPVAPMSRAARDILGLLGALRAACEPLLPGWIGRNAGSLADLIRQRCGTRVRDLLVAPVTRGVYSADPTEVSVGVLPVRTNYWWGGHSLISVARAQRTRTVAAGAAVASLRGGMHGLIVELSRQLEQRHVSVRLRSAVSRVHQDVESCVVEGRSDCGVAFEDSVSAVIITAPGVHVASTHRVPVACTQAVALRNESHIAGTVEVVALMLNHGGLSHAPRGNGVLVGSGSQFGAHPIRAKALTHSSAKWSWISDALPQNRHLIRLSYGITTPLAQASAVTSARAMPKAEACTLGLSDTRVREIACRDASALLGVQISPHHVVALARQPHLLFSPDSNLGQLSAPSGCCTRVFHAGEQVSGVGLAAIIPAARETARKCHARCTRDANSGSCAWRDQPSVSGDA